MCVREIDSRDENGCQTHGLGTRTPETEIGGVIGDVSPSLCIRGFFTPLITREFKVEVSLRGKKDMSIDRPPAWSLNKGMHRALHRS